MGLRRLGTPCLLSGIALIPLFALTPASCRISAPGQSVQDSKECRWLTFEKTHVGQELDHAHRDTLCLGGTNNRTFREVFAEKWAWLRHDEIGGEVFTWVLG